MEESLRETRCQHDMLEWPDLGYSSCATCKGMAIEIDFSEGDDD